MSQKIHLYFTHVKCSRYVSVITIIILVWSYDYSKCSETNVYVKESMSCREQSLYQKVTSGDQETVDYVFTDIPFLDSHNPYVFKKWLSVVQGKSTQNDT